MYFMISQNLDSSTPWAARLPFFWETGSSCYPFLAPSIQRVVSAKDHSLALSQKENVIFAINPFIQIHTF